MNQQSPNNWQHLEPPLDTLDRDLGDALAPGDAPADLADRVFEATADHAMAGPIAGTLRRGLAAEPPPGLAERVLAATEKTTQPAANPQRTVLARLAPFAAAAGVLLAVGVTLQLNTAPDLDPAPANRSVTTGPETTPVALEDTYDAIEWSVNTEDTLRQDVSALAAHLDDFDAVTTAESDAALEDELTRQLYYYELAEAQAQASSF